MPLDENLLVELEFFDRMLQWLVLGFLHELHYICE
jgi:hypothetical protein